VPSAILNKVQALTADERLQVRHHALFGRHMANSEQSLPPLVATVAGQHHERMDGSGYPDGLLGEEIHPVSRICAVVDSFDAMTALRPFKDRALTVAEAIAVIQADTPARYDPDVVDALLSLVTPQLDTPKQKARSRSEHRAYTRYEFCCLARVLVRMPGNDDPREEIEIDAVTRNLSRAGIALRCKVPIPIGERVRIFLQNHSTAREQFSGSVIRCNHLSDGQYEIGVSFAMASVHLMQTRAGADDR
jgi:hypothetical protein